MNLQSSGIIFSRHKRAISEWGAITSLLSVLIFSGCGRSDVAPSTAAVATPEGVVTVGSRVISEADILHEAARLREAVAHLSWDKSLDALERCLEDARAGRP